VGTALPPGTYCDVLAGGGPAGPCAGASLVVASAGRVQFSLEARTAVALHVAQ
jgi:hypothetical protein